MEVRRLPVSNPNLIETPDIELYHHGIKGQRWGFRRFQNRDGTLTAAGRKRKGLIETVKNRRKMKKLRAAKVKKQQERVEREKIIKSGDIKKIKKIKDTLTDEEVRTALERIDFNRKLSQAAMDKKSDKYANVARLIDKYSKTASNVQTYANAASAVVDFMTKARKFSKGIPLPDEKKKK